MCACVCSPRLGLVVTQHLVGPEQLQLAVALLKHVDASEAAGRRHQGLLHTRRVDHARSVHHGAGATQRAKVNMAGKFNNRLAG